MSSGEVRRVSRQDIQLVQNLIERCLQLYMNQKEVVQTLLDHAKIEPGFTELVWQKLEEENQEFFKAYHLRLMVKQQIILFNKLLEQHVQLMRNMHTVGAVPSPLSNGSQNFPVLQNASCYANEQASTPGSDNMHVRMNPSGSLINGGMSMHEISNQSITPSERDLYQSMLLVQNLGMDMLQGMNGIAIKSEPNSIKSELNYTINSDFVFGAEENFLESRATGGPVPVSFNSTDSNSQPLTESSLEANIGILGHIPPNFSLSDLTASFPQGSEILENYCRSPFIGTETSSIPDSPGNNCQGENKRLDTISEGLSYEELVSSD